MSICRRITKLVVNIAKCETHITYADASRRQLCHNRSGFMFHEATLPRPEAISCSMDADAAASFLQHHFGDGNAGANCALSDSGEDSFDFMDEEGRPSSLNRSSSSVTLVDTPLKTIQIEQQPLILLPAMAMKPQFATVLNWPTGRMKVFNRSWHLQNCAWRKRFTGDQQPKCHCLQIKEKMDCINEMVSVSLLPENKVAIGAESSIRLEATMGSMNIYLKELNELLEQQAKLSRSTTSMRFQQCDDLRRSD